MRDGRIGVPYAAPLLRFFLQFHFSSYSLPFRINVSKLLPRRPCCFSPAEIAFLSAEASICAISLSDFRVARAANSITFIENSYKKILSGCGSEVDAIQRPILTCYGFLRVRPT